MINNFFFFFRTSIIVVHTTKRVKRQEFLKNHAKLKNPFFFLS